ncbi:MULTISPECIES: ADP compounds hydrolase NudE [Corallincola]|uniref:ADP compounds hydrolase NudE n=3 Tax=Corallincola TaxID=1775176 RepID=A0A368NL34_9GAMM|nr:MULTISPECIES: ADP compounds hydrolase NudE [Corallincola]RCU51148.1 ADP compounds hydrolase NudE [Corallincola holothuriorum]TAA46080.1 ADP compounds hydrolase NudE [Corallincola spongiicola]TCI01444.1 ADP compounds hydrolase NudE [Corallincola luteus]
MSQEPPKRQKPKVLARRVVAQSRLFTIEALDLAFSNGARREYERMQGSGRGAVMMIPISGDNLILVREYAAGTDSYELGFPKGLIDPGETPEQAADRELKEEIGFGCQQLTRLKTLTMAPAYFGSQMTILLAQDLYPEQLQGDEPEPLERVYWPVSDMLGLVQQEEFCEARSIAAVYLAHQWLQQKR